MIKLHTVRRGERVAVWTGIVGRQRAGRFTQQCRKCDGAETVGTAQQHFPTCKRSARVSSAVHRWTPTKLSP